jgi:hypothetical protein
MRGQRERERERERERGGSLTTTPCSTWDPGGQRGSLIGVNILIRQGMMVVHILVVLLFVVVQLGLDKESHIR